MVYCIVGGAVSGRARASIERFYREDPGVTVLPGRRQADRRTGFGRRAADRGEAAGATPVHVIADRRRIRSSGGRRVAERRAPQVPAYPEPTLSRALRRHASNCTFVVRLEQAPRDLEDAQSTRLATRFQSGEPDAFQGLYSLWFDRVYSYVRLTVGGPDRVEAGLHEAFGRLHEALRLCDLDARPFTTWLASVLFEFSCDADPLVSDRDSARVSDTWVGEHDLQVLEWLNDHDLMSLIERLPRVQREVMALHYLLGLAPGEIAEVVGLVRPEVDRAHAGAVRFMAGCLTSLGRRPGYSGRHPIKQLSRPNTVIRQRRGALSA